MAVEYNKGNISEAILAAAVAARFKKRFKESDFASATERIGVGNMKAITVMDVEEVLAQLVSGGAQYNVRDFDKKQRKRADIFDNISVSVSIPGPDMNFLTQRSNWSKVQNIFSSAVAKVNQDIDLTSNSYKLTVNLREDQIDIRGIGTENQQGTKVDLLVEVRRGGKKVRGIVDTKISLKYDAPQFAQAVGLDFDNFGTIFDPLGLNDYAQFSGMFQEEVMIPFPDILGKKFDSRDDIISSQEVQALKRVAKEVFKKVSDQLKTKLFDEGFKELLAKYCIEKATRNESGVELVKFNTTGGQSTQKFGQQFVDNLKSMNLDVTYESSGSDPKIVIHEKGKGTGSEYKLIQFRYRTDASSSDRFGKKRIVMRSYVESGNLLYKL